MRRRLYRDSSEASGLALSLPNHAVFVAVAENEGELGEGVIEMSPVGASLGSDLIFWSPEGFLFAPGILRL
jgi:hypothetical protein